MPNATDGIDVALATFGGIFTDMDPACLPDGSSPDSQDVCFLPGDAFTRPAFKRLYIAGAFLADVVWSSHFTLNSGLRLNLYLTTDGSLWEEDAVNTPGAFVQFGTVPAGSRCKAVAAFGRMYFTFSDGVHGTDHAWQYDGTNFDRVSQDGPAAAISVTGLTLPPVAMVSTIVWDDSISNTFNIASLNTALPNPTYGGIYTNGPVIPVPGGPITGFSQIVIIITMPDAHLAAGQTITIAGNSNPAFNGTFTIASAGGTQIVCNVYNACPDPSTGLWLTGSGGTVSFPGNTATRGNNTVSVKTSAAHGLQIGYQAQIAGLIASPIGGGISPVNGIVINNENQPGIATITTNSPHGLVPKNQININGVSGQAVGGGIVTIARSGQVVTVTTNSAHGLQSGSDVLIAGVTDATYNGQFTALAIPSPLTFTYVQADVDSASTAGTVTTVWPIANPDPALNFYTVLTCPTPKTFTIALSYTDGVWSNGTISFGWDGVFYVTSTPTPTSFTYLQYGPDAISNAVGTVTPYGQAEPGIYNAVCLFQTRNGAVTAPGPAFQFVMNGGQYFQLTGVPIGPPDVILRIIALTGANGSTYRYLGVAPYVGTKLVGTSSILNDNVSTTALFDFGNASLFDGTGIDIDGNNTFAQVTLGPVCGVEYYADRMAYYGEDNRVINLLNMGFEGGYLSGSTQPLGWSITGAVALGNASNGGQYLSMGAGSRISQSAYQTSIGAAILDPTQTYAFKAKVLSAGTPSPFNVVATLSSVSAGGVIATAALPSYPVPAGQWQYYSVPFTGVLPKVIPADTLLTIFTTGAVAVGIDEMAIIFSKKPYNENTFRASYVINPEAFDGNTGTMGPSQDTSKIQSTFIVRGTLNINTRDRLHVVKDLNGTEPGGWDVVEVENECGAVSLYGLVINKKGTGGGANWGAWASDGGAVIYGGGSVGKISLDIQQIWDTINPDALTAITGVNDQVNRRMYFFVPTSATYAMGVSAPAIPSTVPNQTIVLDYRRLDTAEEIADKAPIRATLSGNIIAQDLGRKWTKWSGPSLTAGYVFKGRTLTLAFSGAGKANIYCLDSKFQTDDDYGQIPAYHVTSPFASDDSEQGLQLGHHRHLFAFLAGLVTGRGNLQITPMADDLANVWPALLPYELSNPALHDMEMGLQVAGTKMFLKIQATPIAAPLDPISTPPNPKYTNGTDTFFDVSRLCVTMRAHPMAPVRGRI